MGKESRVQQRDRRDPPGLTVVEVLVATVILTVGLLGVLSAFPTGYLDVVGSGGQSKAMSYARQKMEELKNGPFTVSGSGNDVPTLGPPGNAPDVGFTRSWIITQVAGTTAPLRLARITVTVNFSGGGGGRPQTVRLETMRAE